MLSHRWLPPRSAEPHPGWAPSLPTRCASLLQRSCLTPQVFQRSSASPFLPTLRYDPLAAAVSPGHADMWPNGASVAAEGWKVTSLLLQISSWLAALNHRLSHLLTHFFLLRFNQLMASLHSSAHCHCAYGTECGTDPARIQHGAAALGQRLGWDHCSDSTQQGCGRRCTALQVGREGVLGGLGPISPVC